LHAQREGLLESAAIRRELLSDSLVRVGLMQFSEIHR
jgi:hypothetical protein